MNDEKGSVGGLLDNYRLQWQVMTLYERFEQVVAHILSVIVAVIILAALWQLVRTIIDLLWSGTFTPLSDGTFQSLFGMVMTLLIAMEFKHSITKVMVRHEHIVQVKTVILIALLAIARKFIILDSSAGPLYIGALAFSLVALGIVYWLMRQRDDALDAFHSDDAMRKRSTDKGEL
ncbi:phosphate-starvation-inducible PsiE family protein [Cupriavidus oxalaticus]|uniref:phosphate-starvation-inducible PsiE family protein n=1 Tax=Cupriavidus oxalaticus TaxID=96344 RepID=UPI00316C090A